MATTDLPIQPGACEMESLPQLIQDHYSSIGTIDSHGGPYGAIVAGLSDGTLTREHRHKIIAEAGIAHDEAYRKEELDLVLGFLKSAVASGSFRKEGQSCFEALKALFEVREGEFMRWRPVELAALLGSQLEAILEDNIIDPGEDAYQAALQDALDLGFDQYMALCRRAFENVARRVQDAIRSEPTVSGRVDLQRKLEALRPLIRLAEIQQRTLGALY